MRPLRLKALDVALAEASCHVREVGGNNYGPRVKQYLAEVGLPQGYPWCDAFVSFCFHKAAGYRLDWESAGVGVTYGDARARGWLVKRPFRGDLVLYDFNGHGPSDHIGFVVRVLSIRILGCWLLKTVEGNTESGAAGSQADGGGVYLRRRLVRRSRVAFVRVPDLEPRSTRKRIAVPRG
jgi:hypothetical protein